MQSFPLQELSQKTDKAETHGGRVDVQHGSAAGVARAGAAGAATGGAARVGVVVVGSALELALDVAVSGRLGGVLLQSRALVRDVSGRGHGEGTDDIVELGHEHTVMVVST